MKGFFRLYWPKLLLLLLLFAAALRITHLFSALDYDEIWTMSYFSSKGLKAIFTELSLPNNQPLNSLCVKLALGAELPLWGIRLHSLAAGILAVFLMIPIGLKIGGSRRAGFWSAFFLCCSAPAALYSQQARGYELQLFFLLLYTWGLLYSSSRKFQFLAPAAAAAGGVCAILTLPTSVIYLGCITAGFFVLRPRLPGKALCAVLLGGILFSALWYGINFSQFRTGQQWGEVISSHKGFFTFAFKTLDSLIPLSWCPFLIGGICFLSRRKGAVLAGGILLVLLTALVTRSGPPRVYMPLAAAAALLCGAGMDQLLLKLKKFKGAVAAAAVLCAVGGFYFNQTAWAVPDWYALYARGKSRSPDTLVVYSGTNGFPVMWNNQPDSLEENAARLRYSGLKKLLCFTGNKVLNGVDAKFNEAQLPLKNQGRSTDGGFLYGLEEITVPADGDEVILITLEEEKAVDQALMQEIEKCGKFLRLNIFFEQNRNSAKISILRGGVISKSSGFDWKKLPSAVRLYRITSL